MNRTKRAAFAVLASVAFVFAGCKSTEKQDANQITATTATKSTSTTSKTTTTKDSSKTTKNSTKKSATTTTNTKSSTSSSNKSGTSNAGDGSKTQTTTTTTTTTTKKTLSPDEWPENNKKLLAQVEKSRQQAIASGAETYSPLAFKTAEEEYKAEKDAVAKGEKVDLSQALNDLDARYKGLAALADAKQKKARIDSLGVASSDQKSYDEGSSLVDELSSSKAAIYSGEDFYKKAKTANDDFDKVLAAAGLSSSTKVDPATYPANNKRLFEQVEKSRLEAINAGAEEELTSDFDAAEKIYNADKAIVESGEQVDISASLRDLNNRYRAMATIIAAQEKKDLIDELGYASYSMSNYTKGSDLLSEVTGSSASSLTGEQAFQKANIADACFARVLDTAYRSLAEQERRAAYKAKLNAESVKAQISRKDEYVEGVEKYRSGYKMFTSRNPEASVEEFKQSKETFQNLYEVISKARAEALKKIEDAKKRVDESEATAAAADKVAPLGNQPVKGIEAADAKLLEDDDFSYTENTEIEVESTSLTSSEEVTE
ncbi:MAG: hypothetical protein IKP51_08255 [Treponema sp.]|nr:hypothetical protein [Treponema sp.]